MDEQKDIRDVFAEAKEELVKGVTEMDKIITASVLTRLAAQLWVEDGGAPNAFSMFALDVAKVELRKQTDNLGDSG